MSKEGESPHLVHDDKTIRKILATYGASLIDLETVKVTSNNNGQAAKGRTLAYTQIGLYLLSKRKVSRKTKIAQFISFFDIKNFEFKTENSILLTYGNTSETLVIDFQSGTAFVKCFLEIYSIFMARSPLYRPIEIRNAPSSIQQMHPDKKPNDTMINHYYSLCMKYEQLIDAATKDTIEQFEHTNRVSLTLTNKCANPICYKLISLLIIHEPRIKILRFEGFAPKNVCKILHHVLKHNNRIKSIYISNYFDNITPVLPNTNNPNINIPTNNNFIVEQLDFNSLPDPSPISWTFTNLNFDEPQLISFFVEFSHNKGDVQKISINGFQLTAKTGEKLAKVLTNSYCCRTLEYLELNNLKTQNDEEARRVFASFYSRIKNFRMIQVFSLSGWSTPIVLDFVPRLKQDVVEFLPQSTLRHLSVSYIDLRNIKSQVSFPSNLNVIELTNCTFNCASLTLILKAIPQIHSPVILSLKSIKIEPNEYNIFSKMAHDLPKLTNLVEIDYSDNQISKRYLPEFFRIFISSSIRYIALNGCFGPSQVIDLCKVLSRLRQKNIWGIEIMGSNSNMNNSNSTNTVLGEKMKLVMNQLQRIPSLQYINISNQNWAPTLGKDICNYLLAMKNLKYIAAEGAGFADLTSFMAFYNFIFNTMNLVGVSKPLTDLITLLGDPSSPNYLANANANPNNMANTNQSAFNLNFYNESLEKLMNQFKTRPYIPSRIVRSSYFMRYSDMSNIPDFIANFPVFITGPPVRDPFNLKFVLDRQFDVRSLLDFEFIPISGKFSLYQQQLLELPFDDIQNSNYKNTIAKFALPAGLKDFKGQFTTSPKSTAPRIQPRINSREILSNYREWISSKHQRLFRNLSMLNNLFIKVNEEGSKETFGLAIPMNEPPTFTPIGTVQVLSNQIESITFNDLSSDNEDEISVSMSTTMTTQVKGDSSGSLMSTFSENNRSSIQLDGSDDTNETTIENVPSLNSPMLDILPMKRGTTKPRKSDQIHLVNIPDAVAKRHDSFLEMLEFDPTNQNNVEEIDTIPLSVFRENIPNKQQTLALEKIEMASKDLYTLNSPRYLRIEKIPISAPLPKASMPDILASMIKYSNRLCVVITSPQSILLTMSNLNNNINNYGNNMNNSNNNGNDNNDDKNKKVTRKNRSGTLTAIQIKSIGNITKVESTFPRSTISVEDDYDDDDDDGLSSLPILLNSVSSRQVAGLSSSQAVPQAPQTVAAQRPQMSGSVFNSPTQQPVIIPPSFYNQVSSLQTVQQQQQQQSQQQAQQGSGGEAIQLPPRNATAPVCGAAPAVAGRGPVYGKQGQQQAFGGLPTLPPVLFGQNRSNSTSSPIGLPGFNQIISGSPLMSNSAATTTTTTSSNCSTPNATASVSDTEGADLSSDVEDIEEVLPTVACVNPEEIQKAPNIISNRYTTFGKRIPPEIEPFS